MTISLGGGAGTGGGISNVVEDTTPQLGGDLDANGKDILIDSGDGIHDESDNEQLLFSTTASAVNHLQVKNAIATAGPTLSAIGSDTNIALNLTPKGTGDVVIAGTGSRITFGNGGFIDGATATEMTIQVDTESITLDDTNANRIDVSSATGVANIDFAAINLVTNGGKVITTKNMSITVENPSSSEDITVSFTNRAITITEIRAVLIGSSTPSVTWELNHGTDRTSATIIDQNTTTSVTTGDDITTITDATVPADSFVWLTTTAQSGTVTEIHVTAIYTEDE